MPYLQIFNSPLPNRAPIFSKTDEPTYGMLYIFRDSITKWSFSVSAYNKYLQFLQKSRTAPFLLILNEEHLLPLEIHHRTFIMITVDSDKNNKLYSIVIKSEVPTAIFVIKGLLNTIKNIPYELFLENLKSIQWKEEDGSALLVAIFHQQLSRVHVSLIMCNAHA